jgi:hypothetical protein
MSKRIIISERQYGRIFLNEQRRNTIRSKDPIKPYIDSKGKYQDGGQNQNKAYKKHIKTKEDGDKFREWVYKSKDKVDYVNKELKSLGLKDGFSKSGPYGNTHFLVAWELLGLSYLSDVTSDGYQFLRSKSISELLEKHIKTKEDGDKFREWVLRSQLRKDTLNEIYKDLGYSDGLEKKGPIDNKYFKVAWQKYGADYIGENLEKERKKKQRYENSRLGWTTKGKVDMFGNPYGSARSIEPYLGSSSQVLYKDAQRNWDKVNKFFGWTDNKNVLANNDNIRKIIDGEIPKSTCIDPAYLFDKVWGILSVIDLEFGGADFWNANASMVSEYFDNTAYTPKITKKMIEYGVHPNDIEGLKEQLVILNKYKAVLQMVKTHNNIITMQSKVAYQNACDDCDDCRTHYQDGPERLDLAYKTYKVPITDNASGIRMASLGVKTYEETVSDTFTRKDMCKNNGGIFLIPDGPNSRFCCCVNPSGSVEVPVKSENGNYTATIDIQKFCEKSRGDIRDGMQKFGDWGHECVNDWHCIADIVSIAAYAFGPIGIALSVIADLVSGIGYAIEGDEGWEMNAGLTLLGALGGVGEAASLAVKGGKFSKKLDGLNNILEAGKGKGIFELENDIAKWSENLTKSEKLHISEVKKLLESKKGIEVINNLKKEVGELTKIEKGQLLNVLKENDPKIVKKLFAESGDDISKMVTKSFKGVKQVVLQGSLFAGMYIYSKEMGEWLVKIHEEHGWDPLGIFNGDDIVPYNPLDGMDWSDILKNSPDKAKEIENKLNDLINNTNNNNVIKYDEYSIEYFNCMVRVDNLPIDEGYKKTITDKLFGSEGLDEALQDAIYNKGLEVKVSNSKITKVIDIYKNIEFIEDNGKSALKAIDDVIEELKNMGGNEISKEKQFTILKTGNPDVTEEESIDLVNLFKEIGSMEKKKEGIKEEVERIKSLFTEERLYGNIINEAVNPDSNKDDKIDADEFAAADNEITPDEAYEFLGGEEGLVDMLQKKNSYIRKTSSGDDMCLRKGSGLKTAYDLLKSNNRIGFQMNPSSKIGCALTMFSKNPEPKSISSITLFEGQTGRRFNMLIKIDPDEDVCETTIGDIGETSKKTVLDATGVKWNVAVDGYQTTPPKFGLGLSIIKVDGTWDVDNDGQIIIKEGVVMKLLNKNYKGIPTKIDFLTHKSTIPGFSNTGNERGGDKEWMKFGLSCISIRNWIGKIMDGDISDSYNLNNLIENAMN